MLTEEKAELKQLTDASRNFAKAREKKIVSCEDKHFTLIYKFRSFTLSSSITFANIVIHWNLTPTPLWNQYYIQSTTGG